MNIHTMKSDLSDIAHHAMDSAESTVHDGRDAVVHASRSVGHEVVQAVSHAAVRFVTTEALRTLRRAAAVAGVGAFVAAVSPGVTVGWALRAMGLQRRPSAFTRVARGTVLVLAGATAGAGIALLFAPRSGAESRQRIAGSLKAAEKEGAHMVEALGTKAEGILHDVESMLQDPPQTHGHAHADDVSPPSHADGASARTRGAGMVAYHSPTG